MGNRRRGRRRGRREGGEREERGRREGGEREERGRREGGEREERGRRGERRYLECFCNGFHASILRLHHFVLPFFLQIIKSSNCKL
jgi:hypothetical protein